MPFRLQQAGIGSRRNVGSCPETLSTNQKHRCSVKRILTITACFAPCGTSAVCGAQLCPARGLAVASTALTPGLRLASPQGCPRPPPLSAPAHPTSASLPPGLGLKRSLLFFLSLRKGAIFVPFCVSCPIQSFPSFFYVPKSPSRRRWAKYRQRTMPSQETTEQLEGFTETKTKENKSTQSITLGTARDSTTEVGAFVKERDAAACGSRKTDNTHGPVRGDLASGCYGHNAHDTSRKPAGSSKKTPEGSSHPCRGPERRASPEARLLGRAARLGTSPAAPAPARRPSANCLAALNTCCCGPSALQRVSNEDAGSLQCVL